MIKIDEFRKVELKVGRVKEVKEHPNADKLYVVTVDLGSEERQMVAGVKEFYKAEELTGKSVVVAANLEPATIRGVESNGMILASRDSKGLTVLVADKAVDPGSPVS